MEEISDVGQLRPKEELLLIPVVVVCVMYYAGTSGSILEISQCHQVAVGNQPKADVQSWPFWEYLGEKRNLKSLFPQMEVKLYHTQL